MKCIEIYHVILENSPENLGLCLYLFLRLKLAQSKLCFVFHLGAGESWGGAKVERGERGRGTKKEDLILDFSSHYWEMVHFQFCISRTKRLSDDLFHFLWISMNP